MVQDEDTATRGKGKGREGGQCSGGGRGGERKLAAILEKQWWQGSFDQKDKRAANVHF